MGLKVRMAFRFGEGRLCKILLLSLNINGTEFSSAIIPFSTSSLITLLSFSLHEQSMIYSKGRKPLPRRVKNEYRPI